MPTPVADFEGLLRAFADRNVSSVIIGGVSAALQGVPTVTYDLDLVLKREALNLDLAFDVLQSLDAVFREHLPKRLKPERVDLESDGALLLMTRLGPLDLLGKVATGWGYPELADRAHTKSLGPNLTVQVLELRALIEIKELIGREKDLAALPEYRLSLQEIEAREAKREPEE